MSDDIRKALAELVACPFCGKDDTLKLMTAQELAEEGDDDPMPWLHSESWGVICDASSPGGPGGCGATGGFFPTAAEAASRWNARAALAQPAEPVALKQTFTRAEVISAIEAERHACSMEVWMTLMEAYEPGADDLGLDGWMREAEQRIKNRSANDPEVCAAPPAPQPAQSLTMQMQQMCSDWGTYWRASDAHGVNLSHEQALELLRFALGVEVEIAAPQPAGRALTDEQISNRLWETEWPEVLLSDFVRAKLFAFARAIERAHGIKSEGE